MFACTNIEGTRYLDVYMQDECWQGNHYTYTTSAAIPALIVWGMGLPSHAFYCIYK